MQIRAVKSSSLLPLRAGMDGLLVHLAVVRTGMVSEPEATHTTAILAGTLMQRPMMLLHLCILIYLKQGSALTGRRFRKVVLHLWILSGHLRVRLLYKQNPNLVAALRMALHHSAFSLQLLAIQAASIRLVLPLITSLAAGKEYEDENRNSAWRYVNDSDEANENINVDAMLGENPNFDCAKTTTKHGVDSD